MITFRSHVREDIPLRVKWLNNQTANYFAIDDPEHITTPEEQEKWFDNYEKNNDKRFFTICDGDKPIGFIGLSKINLPIETANLFIMIGEDNYRGKGIGKIAVNYLTDYGFKKLGLKKIELEVKKENLHAIEAFKSAGFVETGLDEKEIKMTLNNTDVIRN